MAKSKRTSLPAAEHALPHSSGGQPARGGPRADKHAAILSAARTVFGRDGYSRTSMETIAQAAVVSTRTLYNHFESKEHLFSAVLLESATQVADGFQADVACRLFGTDPMADLIALGHVCAGLRSAFPDHFAIVRWISAEGPHFPPAAVAAWQAAGPLRVRQELARRLQELAERGLLRIDDSLRAADHFSALVTIGSTTYFGASPPGGHNADDAVTAGIDAFLNGYTAARPSLAGAEHAAEKEESQQD